MLISWMETQLLSRKKRLCQQLIVIEGAEWFDLLSVSSQAWHTASLWTCCFLGASCWRKWSSRPAWSTSSSTTSRCYRPLSSAWMWTRWALREVTRPLCFLPDLRGVPVEFGLQTSTAVKAWIDRQTDRIYLSWRKLRIGKYMRAHVTKAVVREL